MFLNERKDAGHLISSKFAWYWVAIIRAVNKKTVVPLGVGALRSDTVENSPVT